MKYSKIRTRGESPIRGDAHHALRDVIDGMDALARRAVFRVLARASTESRFDAASVDVVARRIARGTLLWTRPPGPGCL